MPVLLLLAAFQGVTTPGEPPRLRNPEGLIGFNDYPAEALRRGEYGIVPIVLRVSDKGKVTGCDVTETSGSDALDFAACSLARKRGRFDPATDSSGAPVAGIFRMATAWGVEQHQPSVNAEIPLQVAALPQGYKAPVRTRLVFNADGRVTRCEIATTSGSEAADRAACQHLTSQLKIAGPKSRLGNVEAVAVRYATTPLVGTSAR